MDCHKIAKAATEWAQKEAEDMESSSGLIAMLECQIGEMQEQIEALLEIIDTTDNKLSTCAKILIANFIKKIQGD